MGCRLGLLGLLALLSLLSWLRLCWWGLLLWLLLGLPLTLSLLNSQTTSCHHDSPRWTTMKSLNLPKSALSIRC